MDGSSSNGNQKKDELGGKNGERQEECEICDMVGLERGQVEQLLCGVFTVKCTAVAECGAFERIMDKEEKKLLKQTKRAKQWALT